jgi:hypothetical protein
MGSAAGVGAGAGRVEGAGTGDWAAGGGLGSGGRAGIGVGAGVGRGGWRRRGACRGGRAQRGRERADAIACPGCAGVCGEKFFEFSIGADRAVGKLQLAIEQLREFPKGVRVSGVEADGLLVTDERGVEFAGGGRGAREADVRRKGLSVQHGRLFESAQGVGMLALREEEFAEREVCARVVECDTRCRAEHFLLAIRAVVEPGRGGGLKEHVERACRVAALGADVGLSYELIVSLAGRSRRLRDRRCGRDRRCRGGGHGRFGRGRFPCGCFLCRGLRRGCCGAGDGHFRKLDHLPRVIRGGTGRLQREEAPGNKSLRARRRQRVW